MSWPSPLTTIELHAPICNGHPSYINHLPLPKSLAPICISKGLSKSANLSTGGANYLLLSSPKAWWQGSSHYWDSFFLNKSNKVGQPLRFMFLSAMAILRAMTSANGKALCLHMHLRMLVKIRELHCMWHKELALELPKGLMTRFIPPIAIS